MGDLADGNGDTNTQALPPMTWDQGLGHTGGMLALVPSDDDLSDLGVDGGEDPGQLHLTLAYLGDDMGQLDDEQRDALYQMVGQLAAGTPAPTGDVFGHASFNPTGDEPCSTYLVNGPGFPELHDAAVRIGSHVLGDAMADQHPVWVPHVTAGYGTPASSLSKTGPVTFDKLRLALGDNVTDYPLATPEVDMMGEPNATAAAATPNPGVLAPDAVGEHGGIPVTFPVLVVEGLETSDGRYIAPGSLSHRALPIPVLGQTVNSGDGHKGAAVIGKITDLSRVPGPTVIDKESGAPFPEGTFIWTGHGELDPDADATGLARKGYLTGNSVDMSDMDAEYEYADPEHMADLVARMEAGDEDAKAEYLDAPQRLVVTSGKIAATTLVPIPAFAQAYIQIDGQEMTPAVTDGPDALMQALRDMGYDVVTASAAWRSGEVGDECLLCELLASAEQYDDDGYELADAPDAAKRARALKKGQALPPAKGQPAGQARYPIENGDDLDKAIRAVGRGGSDHDDIRAYIIRMAKKLGLESRIPDNWGSDGSLKATAASGAPTWPALTDFANPGLDAPTALTVTDDGEIYGHLATWGTCHIGFAGQCVTPPKSHSDYAYFATGAMRATDSDGELRTVAVGHITMGTGHAGMSLAAKPAAEHYDHTGTVVADVAAGEDAHGIWVHGRARAGTDLVALRAAALSGDWRKIGGRLELVAALAVNVPGFPVPRARVASGEQQSLVAAGAVVAVHGNTKGSTSQDDLASTIGDRVLAYLATKIPDLGLDTGGDQTGESDLVVRRNTALRELALLELDPFSTAR